MCIYVHMCALSLWDVWECACSVPKGQKRASDLLVLEFQVVVLPNVGRKFVLSSARVVQYLNLGNPSLPPS